MSSVPDLIPSLRQLLQSEKDTHRLVRQFLSGVVTQLYPLAAAAQSLRVTPEGLLLRNSTLPDAPLHTFLPLAQLPVHARAVAERLPLVDRQRRCLIFPLLFADKPEILLEIQVAPDYPLEQQAEDALHQAMSAAEQFGLLLESHLALLSLERLVKMSSEISAGADYKAIAAVLGRHLLNPGQFVSINLFERDGAGIITGFRAKVSANRQQAYTADMHFAITRQAERDLFDRMARGEDTFIPNIETDAHVSETLRRQLRDLKIRSLFLLPLQSGGRVTGFISINDTAGVLLLMPVERQLWYSVAAQVAATLENQQYLHESRQSAAASRRQVRILGLLNDLAVQSNAETDETALLQKATRILVEAIGADRCGIVLLEPDLQTSKVVAIHPHDPQLIGLRLDMGQQSVAALMMDTRDVIPVLDVAGDDRLNATTRDGLLAVGVQSALFLPMFDLDKNLMGSIGLDYFNPVVRFEADVLDIARTFAGQIAVSLQKVRLLENTRRQAEQMQRIAVFSQGVQSTLDIQAILETTLRETGKVLPLDYLALMLYDPGAACIRQSARLVDGQAHVELPGTLLTPSINTLVQRVWNDQNAVKVDDLRATWEWQHPYRNTYRAMLAAPISSGHTRRGVLEIATLRSHSYSEADLAALQQICNQIAIALDNAEAFERSQRTARYKALANQISTRLQEQMDVEGILSTTIHELGRAVGARRARIRLGLQADSDPKSQE